MVRPGHPNSETGPRQGAARRDGQAVSCGIATGAAPAHYDRLQKFAEAVKDWDRAIELSPPAEQPTCRASRATSQIRAGMVSEAVAEVAELTTPVANAPGSPKWDAASGTPSPASIRSPAARSRTRSRSTATGRWNCCRRRRRRAIRTAAHIGEEHRPGPPLLSRADFKKLFAEMAKEISVSDPVVGGWCPDQSTWYNRQAEPGLLARCSNGGIDIGSPCSARRSARARL